MDVLLTFVFLLDFSRRLVVARDPKVYLTKGYGWVDAVAAFPVVRILRVLRIVRMLRVMRRLGGPLKAFRAFFSNRAAGGLLSILLVALLVLEFGSLAILWAEGRSPDANITTASDALWYLLVTMSTVGYGDYFPVTELGRLIGSVIIIVGVGVFGTLTGYLANAFLAPSSAVAAVAIPKTQETTPTARARWRLDKKAPLPVLPRDDRQALVTARGERSRQCARATSATMMMRPSPPPSTPIVS